MGDFDGDGKPDLAAANAGSNTVSIRLNTTPQPLPDLVMTAVTPNAGTVNAGATLSTANTVKNQGTLSAGSLRIAYHLSANTTYGDADDVAITTTRTVASLAAGASNTATTSLAIPPAAPAGAYYVCAMADSLSAVVESNETNNTRCSSTQVTVPPPDLIVSALSSTATTANAGSSVSLSNSIKNQGGAMAGSFVVAFHLSTNAIYGDADDIASTTTRTISSLNVGVTSTATTSVLIPSSTPAGTYYLCAKADNGNAIAESDETNNTRCTVTTITVPLPDLTMTALSKTATSVRQGGSFAVSNTVKNQGGSSASVFAIGFVLSTNTTIGDSDDIVLTPQRSVSSLGVGSSSAASTTVTVPSGTATVVYYVGAIADVNGAVSEGNEGNNTRVTTTTITVTP
jgi:subtilase family serine protease